MNLLNFANAEFFLGSDLDNCASDITFDKIIGVDFTAALR